ncbi:hypothetical protein DSO57_1015599 [Entomophthora muscae]|uniref:Uncharacterized protein n=1 Tax=Entomophthora muscae TaxID=34485 RepID=A0ACC2SHV4_9FUNG|nr:hypothetical protein DSO57_1015599 [Entomophthora muscae]
MTLPHTLQPNRPQDSVATDESTSAQIFGVMYITLTGLINSMVPTTGPWAILGKLLSYTVKLAPILWWALPAGPVDRLPASPQEPPQVGSLTTMVYYVLKYFSGNFGWFNVHAKVFWWVMAVYPIVTALTGFQVANLGPYL